MRQKFDGSNAPERSLPHLWTSDVCRKHPAAILALFPAAVALLLVDSCTFAWCDELILCDGMFLKALRGIEWSAVAACAYHPLYPILVYAWTKLFGASHFAVISLSVFISYVACVVVAAIARRRGWWSSAWADVAFVFLFWGGWGFSQLLTTARPDILVLLFAALFVDALTQGENSRFRLVKVFVTAVVLTAAAPYPLPLMVFFCVFMIATTRDADIRRELFVRGFVAMAGFAAGFALVAFYYLLQRDLLRLLVSYLNLNSITSSNPLSFLARVFKGYSFNVFAVLLCLVAMISFTMSRRTRVLACFVLAIPFLMTVGGRYERYYQWAFYVPCVLLAVHAMALRGKKAVIFLITIGIVSLIASHVNVYVNAAHMRRFNDACCSFVNKNGSYFEHNLDVIIAENIEGRAGFYYPLMRHGARVWVRGRNALTGSVDEENFSKGAVLFPCDKSHWEEIRRFIAKIQRFIPRLPERGLVLFYSKEDVENIKPLFEARGCVLHPLEVDGQFSLWRMERSVAQ